MRKNLQKKLLRIKVLTFQELLDKLEKTEARLAQTELDLQSEQNVRRTLQSEVVEAKERETALAQKQVSFLKFGIFIIRIL